VRALHRPSLTSPLALAVYIALAVFYLGVPIAGHPGRDVIGYLVDPQIFIWSVGWWPHAILHGENPIVTHAIWAPEGVNLAWITSVPGLALLAAPVTLLGGPVLSYNLLAIAMPALAAWTAFLLCRYVTHSFVPSLVGGYLFGFSPYLFGQTEGHMHLTSVFLIPLVALVILRYVHGLYTGRQLAVRLGILLAFQIGFSTEVTLTLTTAVVVALVAAFLAVPSARARIRSLVVPLIGGYAIAGVLASPLLAYALLHFEHGSISPPEGYPADLLNLVVPTRLTWIGWHWTHRVSDAFAGNDSENGAYLGLPVVVIALWFAWLYRRRAGARFLVLALLLGIVAELGTSLHVRGHDYQVWLPWKELAPLPAFNNVLPVRLSVFVGLAAAVAVAWWTASTRVPLLARVVLPAAAVAAVVPSLWNDVWHQQPPRAAFFTDRTYRACLQPDDRLLFLPFPVWGDSMLWQAESGYDFQMADGFVSPKPPTLPDPDGARMLLNNQPGSDWRPLVQLARDLGVTMIVVEGGHGSTWQSFLAPLTKPTEIGGVYLFSLRPGGRSACTAGA